jgi:hypothetical protein
LSELTSFKRLIAKFVLCVHSFLYISMAYTTSVCSERLRQTLSDRLVYREILNPLKAEAAVKAEMSPVTHRILVPQQMTVRLFELFESASPPIAELAEVGATSVQMDSAYCTSAPIFAHWGRRDQERMSVITVESHGIESGDRRRQRCRSGRPAIGTGSRSQSVGRDSNHSNTQAHGTVSIPLDVG